MFSVNMSTRDCEGYEAAGSAGRSRRTAAPVAGRSARAAVT
jgi:hypothetical protein